MPSEFQAFDLSHQIALVTGTALGTLLFLFGKRYDTLASRLLSTLLLLIYPMTLIIHWDSYEKVGLETLIPLHLCDLVAVMGGISLIRRKQVLCEIVYFWALAGSIQGLITPVLSEGFPHPVYCGFFIHHFAIVLCALYLPIVKHWHPSRYGWIRAWLWLNVYVFVAILVNTALGTNFAFLARPPAEDSLLDLMGPHPWYLLTLQPLALLFFYVLQSPFLRRMKPARNFRE